MKKIITLFILMMAVFIASCDMKSCTKNDKIAFENDQVVTYYVDDDPNEVLKKINLKVKENGKETLVALNNQLVKVEKFIFDTVGDFTATVTYNKQKLDLKYRVAIRKWDKTTSKTWYDETKESFEIKNASELAGLAELVNSGTTFEGKTIKLKHDIDLNNQEWIPIGTSGEGVYNDMSRSFNGTFDGNNKTIYNLTMTADHETNGEHMDAEGSYYHAGLFGYCKNVTIKDLKLENVRISNGMGNEFVRSLQGTGSLAGRLTGNSLLSNVRISGDIKINGEYKVGGLVGSISGEKITITNCSVKGKEDSYVLGTDALYKDTNNFGGIVGYVDTSEAVFQDVYTDILVNGFTSGGIIGNITEGILTMENICVYGDTVNSEGSFVGGIIGGRFISMTLKNCYVLGSVKTSDEANVYADIIVSKFGDTGDTITTTNVYYNNEQFDSEKVFNTLNATGKKYDELIGMLPETLK